MHGEKRAITLEITSCDDDAFTIRNPSYELTFGDTIEATGEPTIEDHNLIVVIQPQKVGKYILEFTMTIGSEIIIRKIQVIVKP